MKRFVLLGLIIAVLGGGAVAYHQFGGSPEVKRERYLKKAQAYLNESKLNEAIVEFRNAVKADPRSAEARLALGLALVKSKNFRGGYAELARAVDLAPNLIKARYELATLELLSNNRVRAKEHLEKLREQDRNAFETRYLAAQLAVLEKNPEKAIAELKEILNNDPKNFQTYIYMGKIHASLKEYKSAESAYRKAIEVNPKAIGTRVLLAQLYVAMGDREKGEEELIVATRADPENEELLHILGVFYTATRRFDLFEKLYLDLLQKRPDSLAAKKRLAELYLAKGDVKRAQSYTDDILKSYPGDVDGHFFRGRIHLAVRNSQKAIEDFSVVTKGASQFGPGFYYLGIAQRRLGRLNDAKGNLMKAIELLPSWLPPRQVLAQVNFQLGDADLALEQSETILRAVPSDEVSLLTTGSAYFKKGEPQKALAMFQRAKEVNPRSISARMDIAGVYVAQKKFAQATVAYEEVLDMAPDFIGALNSIVELYLVQGKPKEALVKAEGHLSKTKNQAPVYQLLGQLKLSSNEYERGIKYLEKALELAPNSMSTYLLIGGAYTAQGKFDAAIDQYESIVAKKPKAIAAMMMLGILFDKKGQRQKANDFYQKILDINKNFYPAANNLAWNFAQYGGNLDVALGIAQRARESNPEDPTIADTLGWINYKKGSYLNAISLFKESNEKFKGSNPEVLYHLGMAYMKNGEKSLASDALSKAVASQRSFNGLDDAKTTLAGLKSS